MHEFFNKLLHHSVIASLFNSHRIEELNFGLKIEVCLY